MPTLNLLFHLHHETEQERPTPRAYQELLALIRQADALPIGCVWLAEHHLSPTRGRLPAPLLMAVAGARETRRVRLGPCVLVLPLHHPVDLAEQIAMADQLMDGRLAVGLGSGGNAEEFAAYGVPLEGRRARFADGVSLMMRALGGQQISTGCEGAGPQGVLTPRPLQAAGEMVWVAAGSVESARLAGGSGGHLLLARGVAVPNLREQIAAYREARAARDLDPVGGRIQVTRGMHVAATDEEAWREAAHGIESYLRATGRPVEGDLREMARRGDFIVGSPATCATAIRDLAETVPISDLACDIWLQGMAHARMARSLALLGDVAALLAG